MCTLAWFLVGGSIGLAIGFALGVITQRSVEKGQKTIYDK